MDPVLTVVRWARAADRVPPGSPPSSLHQAGQGVGPSVLPTPQRPLLFLLPFGGTLWTCLGLMSASLGGTRRGVLLCACLVCRLSVGCSTVHSRRTGCRRTLLTEAPALTSVWGVGGTCKVCWQASRGCLQFRPPRVGAGIPGSAFSVLLPASHPGLLFCTVTFKGLSWNGASLGSACSIPCQRGSQGH